MAALFLDCLFVGAGGFIGSIMRYLLGFLSPTSSHGFPFATFLINVVGAFFIGFFIVQFARMAHPDPRLLLFLKVGICGGFTTFSTFSMESLKLFENGDIATGIAYVVGSVVFGILAVLLGEHAADLLAG